MISDRATLWLGVCLPRLAIEVFLRTVESAELAGGAAGEGWSAPPAPRGGPQLAVCDKTTILLASEHAETLGVAPGMKRATALALAPDLVLVARDEAREAEALRQAACWALQFTPGVSLHTAGASGARVGPGRALQSGLLLEVAASLRLFGGRQALVARLRAGLAELGFSAQIGCAPNATAAWMLARHHDGGSADGPAQLNARLAALPVALLDEAVPHLAALESIGVRTIKDLAQLPRAGLVRRFGKALLDNLERAFGRHPEPRLWFEAPPVFCARLELLAEVENAEALLFGAQRLIVQLAGWLGARHAAVRCFELRGEHDDLPPTTLHVRITDPSRDASRLTVVLRERLGVTRLPAPVHTLHLHCDEVVSLAPRNADMFPMAASTREGLGRLIERLQARLGRAQVQRVLLAADHRPEAAYRLEIVDDLAGLDSGSRAPGARTPATTPAPGGGALPRPLWLLPRPIAVGERNNRPFWRGPLTLLAGPERIESGWWDGGLVQRDYFIATDESDTMLWIYRERLPDTDSRRGWFIHGRFG